MPICQYCKNNIRQTYCQAYITHVEQCEQIYLLGQKLKTQKKMVPQTVVYNINQNIVYNYIQNNFTNNNMNIAQSFDIKQIKTGDDFDRLVLNPIQESVEFKQLNDKDAFSFLADLIKTIKNRVITEGGNKLLIEDITYAEKDALSFI
jgi:hypothetical protein